MRTSMFSKIMGPEKIADTDSKVMITECVQQKQM